MSSVFALVLLCATLARSTQVLLITQASPNLETPSCLTFLGSYGVDIERYNVYHSSTECTQDTQVANNFAAARIVPLDDESRVVYVQEASVEQIVRAEQRDAFDEGLDVLLARIRSSRLALVETNQQEVLTTGVSEAFVLHQTSTSALVSVPHSLLPVLDTLLPRLFVPVVLPLELTRILPVPSKAVKRVSDWLASLHFNPDVASIVDHISVPQMQNDIRYLTGEDGTSGFVTRHSFTEGSRSAAKWIKARIEATGAECELRPFLPGFAPNVICRYPSTTNVTDTVILSAHYDSRGSFGSSRAPGGNDDGSGVISLLGMARTIKAKGITFRSNVELVAFAGEEQGLLGSRAYAKELRDADANVTLMIQADMLAYHKAGEPSQLGLPNLIGTSEAAQLVANVSHLYSPELVVGYTPACCSDHQTFHEQGFPATQVFERAGSIADPMYHNSGDISNRAGYDLAQVRSIAKVTFATLLHAAGFDILEESA